MRVVHIYYVPGITSQPSSELIWASDGRVVSSAERMLFSGSMPWSAATAVVAAEPCRTVALAASGAWGATEGIASQLLLRGLYRSGLSQVRFSYGAIGMSCCDRWALALMKVRPMGFCTSFCVDWETTARRVHSYIWSQYFPGCIYFARLAEMLIYAPYVDVLTITLNCGWLSRESRTHLLPDVVDINLGYLQQALAFLEIRRPRLVFLETVADLHVSTRYDVRLRWDRLLRRAGGDEASYVWEETRCSPHTHDETPVMRDRLIWTGIRADVLVA